MNGLERQKIYTLHMWTWHKNHNDESALSFSSFSGKNCQSHLLTKALTREFYPTCFSHAFKEQCLNLSRMGSQQEIPQGLFLEDGYMCERTGETPRKWLVPAGPHPVTCLEHPGLTLIFTFQLMLSKAFHIPSIVPSVWVTHRSVLIPDLHFADN